MKAGFILNGVFVNDPRVLNEARILAGNGYQVYVLNLPPDKNVPRFVQFEDNIFLVHRRIPKKANNVLFALENTLALFDYSWNISIKRFIKKYGIEILHAHDLYMARAAKRASDHYKIPLVLDLHENYPAAIKEYHWANRFPSRLIVRPSRWEKKEKKYLSYADRIIVLSSSYRNHLLAKYPGTDPVQVKIYPNVPDVKRMSSYAIDRDILPPYDRKIIFYFGVISQRRGIMTTIEAAEILLRDNQSIHLLLIGPIDKAEKDRFIRLFAGSEISGHLTYYPWKDIGEFPSYVHASAVCISPIIKNPQHESGVANKVFQYMLFGKPILVSDCEPQADIVSKTGCGLVFKSGDPVDMAEKLSELINDNEKCIIMGERGKQAVMKEYNTVKQGTEIIKAYRELSASGKKSADT